jgi:hypothetical protein
MACGLAASCLLQKTTSTRLVDGVVGQKCVEFTPEPPPVYTTTPSRGSPSPPNLASQQKCPTQPLATWTEMVNGSTVTKGAYFPPFGVPLSIECTTTNTFVVTGVSKPVSPPTVRAVKNCSGWKSMCAVLPSLFNDRIL